MNENTTKVIKLSNGEDIVCTCAESHNTNENSDKLHITAPLKMEIRNKVTKRGVVEALTLSRWLQPFVQADDFELESLPARRWVMYRLMPAEDVSICAGDGGTGKTQLYIQIALQSHIPQSYFCQMFPFPDTTPRIYLVSQEDTKDELKLRVAIAKAALREKYTDYKGGFSNFLFESFNESP